MVMVCDRCNVGGRRLAYVIDAGDLQNKVPILGKIPPVLDSIT